MKFHLLRAALFALVPALAVAGEAPRPRLIVAISVDQFSADLFAEYRSYYTAGLRRLLSGVVFPAGYQSHAATETCPGHSTILTGAHPSRTGIIANSWFDQSLPRDDKQVYCSEDPQAPASTHSQYAVSAQLLKVPTLGDRMKAVNPLSRVVSVAGKDRAAIMMGGHAIDQVWFWTGKSFTTLQGRSGAAPAIIGKVNAAVSQWIARPPRAALPLACRAHSLPVTVGARRVGVLVDGKPGDVRGFVLSPEFDRATTDIAIGLIRELRLGSGEAPDVLSIGLSATDYVGHVFGVEGAEMCAQVLGVDANVGRILAALDATSVPYVVVLTADHGGHDVPERNRLRGFPEEARIDPALSAAAMGKHVAAEMGLPGPILLGGLPPGDLYLSADVPDRSRPLVLAAARARYLANPQVAAVFTADELRRMAAPTGPADEWSLAERFRASFDAERSGDLLIALKPHITAIPAPDGVIASHESAWGYDRRVPIVFFRPGTVGFEQPLPVETVDILPTLAALIGLAVPAEEIDGRCLDLDPLEVDTCAGALATRVGAQ